MRLKQETRMVMAKMDSKELTAWVNALSKKSRIKPLDDFSVSPNDPTLAHGSARHLVDERIMKTGVLKLVDLSSTKKHINANDVLNALKTMRPYVLVEFITRATGSRNKALWIFLMASPDNVNMNLVTLLLEKGQLIPRDNHIHISHHAIARVIQRSTSSSDTTKILNMVTHHLVCAAQKVAAGELRPTVDTFHIGNANGKLIFDKYIIDGNNYGWLAKTWLSPDMYTKGEEGSTKELSAHQTWLHTYCKGRIEISVVDSIA